MQAWADRGFHMAEAPGRRLELAEHTWQSALTLATHAGAKHAAGAFTPKPYDHRFDHPGCRRGVSPSRGG